MTAEPSKPGPKPSVGNFGTQLQVPSAQEASRRPSVDRSARAGPSVSASYVVAGATTGQSSLDDSHRGVAREAANQIEHVKMAVTLRPDEPSRPDVEPGATPRKSHTATDGSRIAQQRQNLLQQASNGFWLLPRVRPRPFRPQPRNRPADRRKPRLVAFFNPFAYLFDPSRTVQHSGVLHPADPALVEARLQSILNEIRDAANPNARLITHSHTSKPVSSAAAVSRGPSSVVWNRSLEPESESNRVDLVPASVIGARSAALLYMDPTMMRQPLRRKDAAQVEREVAEQQKAQAEQSHPQAQSGLPRAVLPFFVPAAHFHAPLATSLSLRLKLKAGSGSEDGSQQLQDGAFGMSSTARFLHTADLKHLSGDVGSFGTNTGAAMGGAWLGADQWDADPALQDAAAGAAVDASSRALPAELARMHGGLHDMQAQLSVLEQTASKLQAELQGDQKVTSRNVPLQFFLPVHHNCSH